VDSLSQPTLFLNELRESYSTRNPMATTSDEGEKMTAYNFKLKIRFPISMRQ